MEITEKEMVQRRKQAMREAAEMHRRHRTSSQTTNHEAATLPMPPPKKENGLSSINSILGNLKLDKDLALIAVLAFILLRDERDHNTLLLALLYILL